MPSATLRERLGKLGRVSSESYMNKEKFESSITHHKVTLLHEFTQVRSYIGSIYLDVAQFGRARHLGC